MYLLGVGLVCLLLGISIYLQLFAGFIPCPLCTLQRLTFGLLGILFLLGIFLHKCRITRTIIHILLTAGSILGILLAGRQIWLQHFPSTGSNECGVSLEYMIQVLPLTEVVQKIVNGSAECTQIGWRFLYLDMAEWSLVWFIFFFLFTLCLFKKRRT